jgi:putative aminopeptidase FrvX
MDLSRYLQELTAILAPSGYEDPMIRYMRAAFEKAGCAVEVDGLGNVIARVRPAQDGFPHAVVFAHMDELGFIVRKVESDGFVRLQRLGGVPERAMAAQRIAFVTPQGPVSGIIGLKSHHVTEAHEKYQVVGINDVYVDVGAHDREGVLALGIDTGTPATWYPYFEQRGDLVRAKSLDNRLGCAMLLALLDRAGSLQGGAGLTLIASVQEEFNIRGVITAIRSVQPDLIVCLDITVAHDTPDTAQIGDVRLGGGPSVGMFSFHGRGTLNGLIPNPKLVRLVACAAGERGIPLQKHIFFGGFTDASYAQLEGRGIPAIDLGIPTRYTHSPVETCSLRDMQQGVELLEHFVATLPEGTDLSRG